MNRDDPLSNLYGMSTVGSFQTYLETNTRGEGFGIDFAALMQAQRRMVAMKPAGQLLAEYGAASVLYIKIDCEGFDYRIMRSILDYYEAHRNTTRFPVLINYEDNASASENAIVASRLQKLGYRVYHFRYHVTEAIHDNLHGGPLGEVFAELTQPGDDRIGALNEKTFLLPPQFPQVRKACLKYHIAQSYFGLNTAEGNATAKRLLNSLGDMNDSFNRELRDGNGNPAAYFCSIFITKDMEMLSMSHSFTVYA
jgi:hypothetical protein